MKIRFVKENSGQERSVEVMVLKRRLVKKNLEEEYLAKERLGEEKWNSSRLRPLHYSIQYW